MKTIFTTILLALCFCSYAQDYKSNESSHFYGGNYLIDENDSIYKVVLGVYLTRQEFIDQTPSLQIKNIKIKGKKLFYKRDENTPVIELDKDAFYAYANEQNVFLSYKGLKLLETVGSYCLFYRNRVQLDFFTIGTNFIFPIIRVEQMPYLAHTQEGIVTKCSSGQIKKIIKSKNPELLAPFKKAFFQPNRVKKYVDILNHKNPI
jgi:hypothetical protein